MIEKITSRQNERIKEVIKLYDSKVRKEKGLFIVEGFHLLEMGLLSNAVKEIYTLKEIEGIKGNVKQYQITEEILQKISKNKNPQSMATTGAPGKTTTKKTTTKKAGKSAKIRRKHEITLVTKRQM
mgnify:CR=1 FL=1